MSGLQRGTEDYRVILHRFQAKVYSPHNYNPEQIRNSNSEWQRKYNPVAFAESLHHIVSSLYLAPPPPVPPSSEQRMESLTSMDGYVDEYDGYDDYALQGSSNISSSTTKTDKRHAQRGGGSQNVYSSKHVRAHQAQKSGKK